MARLTQQLPVPDESHEACDRLTTLVKTHARCPLREEYWHDNHLDAIQDHTGQYIRDD